MSTLTQIQILPETALQGEAGETRRICFVCTGNTCRSPMAAAVANDLAAKMAEELAQRLPESLRDCTVPEWEAFSAGLCASDGAPIARYAREALEEAGVEPIAGKDYREHRAHTLTESEAETYDLLVGMTGEHTMTLLMENPLLAKRIVCMPKEIADPFGADAETYRKTLEAITEGVKALLLPHQDKSDA